MNSFFRDRLRARGQFWISIMHSSVNWHDHTDSINYIPKRGPSNIPGRLICKYPVPGNVVISFKHTTRERLAPPLRKKSSTDRSDILIVSLYCQIFAVYLRKRKKERERERKKFLSNVRKSIWKGDNKTYRWMNRTVLLLEPFQPVNRRRFLFKSDEDKLFHLRNIY